MTGTQAAPVVRPRRRRWGALVLGVTALAAAGAFVVRGSPPAVSHITLTAGYTKTTRALVAAKLAAVLAERGVETRLVDLPTTVQELEQVNAGAVDFALVSEAYRLHGLPHLREVAPLYVEALHLLVKQEFAETVGRGFDGLRGRSVDLGPSGTASEGLATAVLAFAGLVPRAPATAGALLTRNLADAELDALLARGDRAALPDAVFHLGTVPSKLAMRLVREAHYTLVGLRFAEAFRLGAMVGDGPMAEAAAPIDREDVYDTVVPAFTYQTEPAVPAEPLHTLGTRLLLVAHEAVAPDTVAAVLDAVFNSEFTRFTQPPLDRSVLAHPPQLPQHAGTVAYLARDQPFVTNDNVDELSNTLSIVGALVGGSLFLWQFARQRRQSRRDEVFGRYMRQIATIERHAAELELGAQLHLEPLVALQQQLLQLKSEALDRFAGGELGDQAALSDLLNPVNAARDHIGDLILHVRDNLEEQADAQGRSAQAVWAEAMRPDDHSADKPA